MAAKKLQHLRDLVLLRHAKSSWEDALLDDFERPLAKRGRKAAKQIAEWLCGQGLRPRLVLCSASVRTRETLTLVADALGPEPAIAYERGLYLADADDLLARLRAIPDDATSVLLIGHNPGIQELALSLTPSRARRERKRLSEKFPTAAVAWFRINTRHWSELGLQEAKLVAFVRPADLQD